MIHQSTIIWRECTMLYLRHILAQARAAEPELFADMPQATAEAICRVVLQAALDDGELAVSPDADRDYWETDSDDEDDDDDDDVPEWGGGYDDDDDGDATVHFQPNFESPIANYEWETGERWSC